MLLLMRKFLSKQDSDSVRIVTSVMLLVTDCVNKVFEWDIGGDSYVSTCI